MSKLVSLENLGKEIQEAVDDLTSQGVKNLNKGFRAAIIFTWTNVIKETPIDKGRARSQWFIDTVVGKGLGRGNKTKGAGYVAAKVPTKLIGTQLYLFNNLPYINKLEYGGYTGGGSDKTTPTGFSKQAPKGMVRTNLAKFPKNLRRATKGR